MNRLLPFLILLGLIPFSGIRVSSDGIRLSQNFHAVDPGKFYRSAQLTKDEFTEIIEKFKIKTVINLQGDRPGYQWYDQEMAAMAEMGVTHYDISMATENIPRKENLVRLLEIYKTAERPILVHCRSGADRAGEASAIYAMEFMGQSKKEALKQLHLKFLHVESFVPSKKYFVNLYQGKNWAQKSYDHCDPQYKYSDRRNCLRAAVALE